MIFYIIIAFLLGIMIGAIYFDKTELVINNERLKFQNTDFYYCSQCELIKYLELGRVIYSPQEVSYSHGFYCNCSNKKIIVELKSK